MSRIIKNIVEAAFRLVASALLIISVSMLYNLIVYKVRAIVILLLLSVSISGAILLILRRRSLATSYDELDSMFSITKKLAKAGSIWPACTIFLTGAATAWNLYCTIALTATYDGIDTAMAELYNVTASAVAVMRCIPGTFAARAFYVVVTEMDDFDFSFYDRLIVYDYVLFAVVVLAAILWTITVDVKRYNQSRSNIENANY